jgi:hypothetical protein
MTLPEPVVTDPRKTARRTGTWCDSGSRARAQPRRARSIDFLHDRRSRLVRFTAIEKVKLSSNPLDCENWKGSSFTMSGSDGARNGSTEQDDRQHSREKDVSL